jgi:Flp pilus assembly protein TadG
MIRRAERDCGAGRAPAGTIPLSHGWGRRLWRDRRGSVIVEFAILAPLLLLLLFGVMIFGVTLNQYATLWNAVGASAFQFAIAGSSSSQPVTLAWNALAGAAPVPTFTNGASCSSGLCLSLYVNGNACATDINSLSAAEAADAAGDCTLTKNVPAAAVATYPCTLQVLQFNFYPNCQLQAQVTELVP